MSKSIWVSLIGALTCVLVAAPPVLAGDVKLLKQPSTFPLVIGAAGSYRLKSNITVPDANTTAIQITTNDVTLDLNGYRIFGPTTCGGNPQSCTPMGGGIGINAAGFTVVIRNGTIRGMGNAGILMTGGRVENVVATHNGGDGLFVGRAIVTGCTATENGGAGVAGSELIVTGSLMALNTGAGVLANGVALGNVVYANGQGEAFGPGIAGNGVVIANVVQGNFSDGVAGGAGTVVNNYVHGNGGAGISNGDGLVAGNALVVNSGDGVSASFAGTTSVIGNAVVSNGGFGLSLGVGNAFETNALLGNTAGTVTGGVAMGTNVCDGSTTCP